MCVLMRGRAMLALLTEVLPSLADALKPAFWMKTKESFTRWAISLLRAADHI